MPYYSVRFLYEARPTDDAPLGYVAGGIVSETTRLDRIDVVHIATGSTVRSYDFTYGAPGTTGRSRLASLQECVPGGCLAATQFGWSFVYAGWAVNFSIPLPVDRLASAIPGDVDGDGFDDLTYHDATLRRWMVLRGNGNGFHSTAVDTGFGSDSDPTQALSADLDGDGKRDVLVPGSGNYWHRLRHTSSGSYAYNALGVINPAPPGGLIAADIDGDGRDDLVYVKAAGDAIYWRRNQTVTSSSYAAEAVLWSLAGRNPAAGGAIHRNDAAVPLRRPQRRRQWRWSHRPAGADTAERMRRDLQLHDLAQLVAGARFERHCARAAALVRRQHRIAARRLQRRWPDRRRLLGAGRRLATADRDRQPQSCARRVRRTLCDCGLGAARRRPRNDHRLGRRRPHGSAAAHGVR